MSNSESLRNTGKQECHDTVVQSFTNPKSRNGEGDSAFVNYCAACSRSVGAEFWFLSGNFFVTACGGHVVAESANAGLGDYKFVASEF
jgi:hypothetical protein